ncbi:MAG: hypothetical protein MI974_18400 [Chitinophagales bacterium]|nr:hypothetical protein [Chitinophagales bacterium]
MDKEYIKILKERYNYEEWFSMIEKNTSTFFHNISLSKYQLGKWQADEQQFHQLVTNLKYSSLHWRTEDNEAVIKMDILECDSHAEAQEQLIIALGDFQHPDPLKRKSEEEGNELLFYFPTEYIALFVTGNLLIKVNNTNKALTSVLDDNSIVEVLKSYLRAPSEFGNQKVKPEIDQFSIEGQGKQVYEIQASISDPLDRSTWMMLKSPTGYVVRKEDKLFYHPRQEEGPHILTLTAVNPNNGITAKRIEF